MSDDIRHWADEVDRRGATLPASARAEQPIRRRGCVRRRRSASGRVAIAERRRSGTAPGAGAARLSRSAWPRPCSLAGARSQAEWARRAPAPTVAPSARRRGTARAGASRHAGRADAARGHRSRRAAAGAETDRRVAAPARDLAAARAAAAAARGGAADARRRGAGARTGAARARDDDCARCARSSSRGRSSRRQARRRRRRAARAGAVARRPARPAIRARKAFAARHPDGADARRSTRWSGAAGTRARAGK